MVGAQRTAPGRSGIPWSLKTALEIRMARDRERLRSIRTAQTQAGQRSAGDVNAGQFDQA
jgi:hypothetical protein